MSSSEDTDLRDPHQTGPDTAPEGSGACPERDSDALPAKAQTNGRVRPRDTEAKKPECDGAPLRKVSSQDEDVSVKDKLYFGTSEIWLVPAGSGHSCAYKGAESVQAGSTPDPLEVPFDRAGEKLVAILPDVPGRPLSVVKATACGSAALTQKELMVPLVKTSKDACSGRKDAIRGAGSGVRSGVIKCSDCGAVRLKGCGNNNDGFPVRYLDEEESAKRTDGRKAVEVRGCCFSPTCARELLMTDAVEAALHERDPEICGANSSLGWWQYDNMETCPACPKHCGLFRTVGDRRMATHLLHGLEIVAAAVTDCTGIKEAVLSAMSEKRLGEEYAGSHSIEAIFDVPIFYLVNSDDFNAELCADLSGVRAGKISSLPESRINEYVKDPDLRAYCTECIKKLAEQPEGGALPFGQLYARLGYEAGYILRVMHDARISWGTYNDALARHCNAHPNNFVVASPESAESQLLAPLDFDMAFTEDEYNTFPCSKEMPFDQVLTMERNAMMLSVGGDTLNSGADLQSIAMPSPELQLLQKALRDTIFRHFYLAYENASSRPWIPLPEDLNRTCRPLIELALCLTSTLIA